MKLVIKRITPDLVEINTPEGVKQVFPHEPEWTFHLADGDAQLYLWKIRDWQMRNLFLRGIFSSKQDGKMINFGHEIMELEGEKMEPVLKYLRVIAPYNHLVKPASYIKDEYEDTQLVWTARVVEKFIWGLNQKTIELIEKDEEQDKFTPDL